MLKTGDQIKFKGVMSNRYGDTDQAVKRKFLIPGKYYKILQLDKDLRIKLRVEPNEEGVMGWWVGLDSVEKEPKKRNLPEWW